MNVRNRETGSILEFAKGWVEEDGNDLVTQVHLTTKEQFSVSLMPHKCQEIYSIWTSETGGEQSG